ncbi:phosphoribosylamine--glycine ligase [Flavobacteriaceae bacterium Ap0902]|nr:phosphoribosylamine--glycine ligase [Flavobacteriaceae bacterium Ap0902]
MKILIVGSGGREHAIGWKIKQDNPNVELFFSVGNAGTQAIGENLGLKTIAELKEFAKTNEVDLTIVGPEMELVDGIVDEFKTAGLEIFGPHQQAAALEGSKVFAKEFMQKHGVKTASYQTFRYFVDAKEYVESLETFPVVIKASGLAAGKGVIIAQDKFEAHEAVKDMMDDKSFGDAGDEVVIEQFLEGFECSILSIYNGKEIVPFISAKDHKKIGEGETGLNTGGMGVIAPNPLFTDAHFQEFVKDILEPTAKGLAEDGLTFSGIIFFGLMITDSGVYLLEYNVRFGDPETEAVLPLMNSNLLEIIQKSNQGESFQIDWENQHACCVVMASGGYPGNYDKGFEIRGLDSVEAPLFIAGASAMASKVVTSGGRVLNVVGLGDSLEEARNQAYENIKKIHFDYEYYREDIGKV